MARSARTLRHARYLSDIEGVLQGSVHRSRERLKTNWCPCCGFRSKPRKRSFSIAQGRDGLLVKCHRCDATFEQIAEAFEQATGIILGGFNTTVVIDNGDYGPFNAELEVLRRIDPDQRAPVGCFGLDEIGKKARRIVGCTVSARQRTPRLKHDPWTSPFAWEFVQKAALRIGWEISDGMARLIAKRIRKLAGGEHFHYLAKHLQAKRGYRALRVLLVSFVQKRTASALALADDFNPAPDSAASSGVRKGKVKSGLERFLGGGNGIHSPPEPAEHSEQPNGEAKPDQGAAKPSLHDWMERAGRALERRRLLEAV